MGVGGSVVAATGARAPRSDSGPQPGLARSAATRPARLHCVALEARGCECSEQAGSGLDAVASTDVPAVAHLLRNGELELLVDAELGADVVEAFGTPRARDVPYQVDKWRREHPGEQIPDGHVFTQPWPAGRSSKRRDQMICYQFRAGRALRGIDEQVVKVRRPSSGWPRSSGTGSSPSTARKRAAAPCRVQSCDLRGGAS